MWIDRKGDVSWAACITLLDISINGMVREVLPEMRWGEASSCSATQSVDDSTEIRPTSELLREGDNWGFSGRERQNDASRHLFLLRLCPSFCPRVGGRIRFPGVAAQLLKNDRR